MYVRVCVCLCVCVCVYACIYVCLYVCMYVRVCVCVCVCMCTYMHACMYVCMYVCIYVCMYVYRYMYIYLCIYIRYTWVRSVALPLVEGKEISHNMAGTLTVEQAAIHSQKSFYLIFICFWMLWHIDHRAGRDKFLCSLSVVIWSSKYSRPQTFENVCLMRTRHSFSKKYPLCGDFV
jgi:hypothetical protein